jgi:hypothetical protein
MFNVRPNLGAPGFNVREPEEEVPGFRLNADGTIGKPPMTVAKPDGNPVDIFEPQPLGAWPPPNLPFARGLGGDNPGPPTANDGYPFLPGATGQHWTDGTPAVSSGVPLADRTLPTPGRPQVAGDVIPICNLITRLPGQCVYWCEGKGANVATTSTGYCPSIIRQPLWL